MLNYHMKKNDNSKTIIFITGAGMSSWMWKNQMTLNYNIITFDLPGHGDNSAVDFISISQTALDIIDIMANENLDKVVLIGHSIGAQIVLHMMEYHVDKIDQAIVISGLNKASKLMTSMIKPMISLTMPLIKKRWFAKLQSKQLVIPADMFESYYEDSLKMSKSTLINLLQENQRFEFDKTNLLGEKVLFIAGQKEVKIMITSAKMNHELVKGSKVHILLAAHGIPYEVPDLFNSIIIDFIG